MKRITRYISFNLLICSVVFVSCNGTSKKSERTITKTDSLTQKQACMVDSLTVDFLEKASYKKAIAVCSITIIDREFALKEIVAFGLRANLGNIFTKEELASNISLKEVTWDGKDGDYITVWYRKDEASWNPIDIFKYGKGTRF
ncbi:hypothetical protein [Aequorivita capsosiphonis]|uniref:hypothetical protein n=1 Tax=Aequorivita capsosiphonis TaxID=487317 RepID=UPI00047BA703|nr:hypothetical protein [Aequorivita capsosiphonis]